VSDQGNLSSAIIESDTRHAVGVPRPPVDVTDLLQQLGIGNVAGRRPHHSAGLMRYGVVPVAVAMVSSVALDGVVPLFCPGKPSRRGRRGVCSYRDPEKATSAFGPVVDDLLAGGIPLGRWRHRFVLRRAP